ncbi:MAG: response regulator [Planctomycetota bacterium]|jgi:CheY-like chemotaxis protein
MNELQGLIYKLSGECKAYVIVSQYRENRLQLQELHDLLDAMVASDLERVGLLEMIRQEAVRQSVAPDSIELLMGGLRGSAGTPPPAPPVPERKTISVRPLEQSKTAASESQPPPPPPLPRQGHRLPRQTNFLKKKVAPPAAPPPEPQTPLQATVQIQPQKAEETFFGGAATAPAFASLANTKKRLVLVADDDPRIRMVFKMRLEKAGFEVVEAPTGDDAWRSLQESKPVAMVMDMKMPGLHGLEILAKLTSEGSTLPVCVCSAYDQLQDEFVIKNYPRLRYFVKPVKADELVTALQGLLQQGNP